MLMWVILCTGADFTFPVNNFTLNPSSDYSIQVSGILTPFVILIAWLLRFGRFYRITFK